MRALEAAPERSKLTRYGSYQCRVLVMAARPAAVWGASVPRTRTHNKQGVCARLVSHRDLWRVTVTTVTCGSP